MKYLMALLAFPLMSQSALALNCFGTEPFWGAEISEHKLTLREMGEEATISIPLTSTSGVAGYTEDFVRIYANMNGPVAVVTSTPCNDGMSDYIYPQQIVLFTGAYNLYGCCGQGVPEGEE